MPTELRRFLVSAVGAAMLLTGLVIGARLGYQMLHQQAADTGQDRQWKQFTRAVQGQDGAAAAVPADAGNIYLKLTVPRLGNKDGVAVDGDWNNLHDASMVHYHESAAPGARGNVLVAFHRETHWLDVNQLRAGDQVQVQARDLKNYTYVIDFVRTVDPGNVSLLRQTDGNDITLVTCDPPWQDYNRMIFRGHLVQAS
ncbi:MAG: sortase [Candidatus Dormibacteraeota bacterium]|nr:sortase [Candidatus Dormibacteraeota bacterium]